MKKLLSLSAIVSLGFSLNFTLMPYGSYIDYSNSVKDHGALAGIYGSCVKLPFKTEIDGEFLKLQYKDGIANYYQRDLTLVEHYYIGNNYEIHGGIHNIFISQANNPDHYQKVLFGGVLYYKYLKYNAGIDYYYSTYRGFDVSQITPKAGFNFGNYYSNTGSFYAEAKVNFINISDENAAGSDKDHYVNTDLSLSNYKGPWTTTLKASLGKNAYKVGDNGFVVYNLGEEYKYSYGVDVNYAFNKKNSVKVGFTRSRFDEGDNHCFSNVFLASFVTSF